MIRNHSVVSVSNSYHVTTETCFHGKVSDYKIYSIFKKNYAESVMDFHNNMLDRLIYLKKSPIPGYVILIGSQKQRDN